MHPEVDHNKVEPEKQADCFMSSCFSASLKSKAVHKS